MNLVIGWPEGIYLAVTVLGAAGQVMKGVGESRRPGWYTGLGLAHLGMLGLLYWGGFFS